MPRDGQALQQIGRKRCAQQGMGTPLRIACGDPPHRPFLDRPMVIGTREEACRHPAERWLVANDQGRARACWPARGGEQFRRRTAGCQSRVDPDLPAQGPCGLTRPRGRTAKDYYIVRKVHGKPRRHATSLNLTARGEFAREIVEAILCFRMTPQNEIH